MRPKNPIEPLSRDDHLDRIFQALSDRTRRALLSRLGQGSAKVTELAKPFSISLPAVSGHLKVLEKAGLVERSVDGRVHRCSLQTGPLEEVDHWLSHYRSFWQKTLDSLAEYTENDEECDKEEKR